MIQIGSTMVELYRTDVTEYTYRIDNVQIFSLLMKSFSTKLLQHAIVPNDKIKNQEDLTFSSAFEKFLPYKKVAISTNETPRVNILNRK